MIKNKTQSLLTVLSTEIVDRIFVQFFIIKSLIYE